MILCQLLSVCKEHRSTRSAIYFVVFLFDAGFQERALLYAVMGKHTEALETYVYDLHDYDGAASYCRDVGDGSPSTPCAEAFSTLIRILYHPDLQRLSYNPCPVHLHVGFSNYLHFASLQGF
jgi:hypothetical protein